MKKVEFFCTPEDIRPVLVRFEESTLIKFVELGMRLSPNRAIYLNSEEVPEAGLATHESANRSQHYLVSHQDTKNAVDRSIMKNGKERWDLRGAAAGNEEAVVLNMAGVWRDDLLLPGSISTIHDNGVGQDLIKSFWSALRKEGFKKVEDWWIGPCAMEMWKDGKRLAANGAEQAPPSSDLKLPEDS